MGRIGKHVAVIVDDSGGTPRTLTGQITSISGIELTYDEVEKGGYGEDKSYLAARADAPITLEGLFNDTADTGTHTVFSGVVGTNTAVTVTIQLGDNATPTTGDPEWEGEYICTSYVVAPDLNGVMMCTAVFQVATSTLPAWGTVA